MTDAAIQNAEPRQILVAGPADLDRVMAFGVRFYGARIANQTNLNGVARWARQALADPDRLVLLHPGAVGIANVNWHYGIEGRGSADVLACDPVEAGPFTVLQMVRMMLEWSRAKGATGPFRLSADTGVDFGPIARRLGGAPTLDKIYDIPL